MKYPKIISLYILTITIIISFISCSTPQPPEEKRPPNILFIAIDDLNDWLGCMNGHPNAKTPNIDRLAARGTLFTNAHCQAPLCGPSRASLMSGLRPSTTGIYGQIQDKNLREAHPLLKEAKFLPQYFGENGYKTMGIGKLFHNHAPEGVFEESGGREGGFGPKPPKRLKWDSNGTSTDWGAFPEADSMMPDYRSAQWAIDRINQDHNRPFFLAVGFLRPHVPWHVPQKWFDMHPLEGIQTPPYQKEDQDDIPEISTKVASVPMMPTTEWAIENQEWKAICQAYLASISFVDNYVGEVIKALEASQYAENTIIVLWSDHGYHLGEKNRFAKHSLWERATKVPLIFAGNNLPQGQTSSKPVELLDLYPTLIDLCKLPQNPILEGKSILPLIKNPDSPEDYSAITTYGWNNHAVAYDQTRYIQYEDKTEELYLNEDINEWENKASDAQHINLKNILKQYLPSNNEVWSEKSNYDNYPYFKAQKERSLQSAVDSQ